MAIELFEHGRSGTTAELETGISATKVISEQWDLSPNEQVVAP